MEMIEDLPFIMLNAEEVVNSRGENDVRELLGCPWCGQEFQADEHEGRTEDGYQCTVCDYEFKAAVIKEEDDGSPDDSPAC